jgi:hypothetical protein
MRRAYELDGDSYELPSGGIPECCCGHKMHLINFRVRTDFHVLPVIGELTETWACRWCGSTYEERI